MSASLDTFAKRLRRTMEDRGISQTELATKTEIDRTEINRLVNGKRAPKPREVAWLIEALGADRESFFAGLDVAADPAFADEIEQHRRLARRVLDAERERDEARAARNAIEGSLRVEEMAWRAERGQLQGALADFRRDCADRVRQRDEELTRREQELLRELSGARDQTAQVQRDLRAMTELANDRRRQLQELQRALEAERSRVTAVGLFGGLVGAVLGGGLGAVVASNQDDDDDKD